MNNLIGGLLLMTQIVHFCCVVHNKMNGSHAHHRGKRTVNAHRDYLVPKEHHKKFIQYMAHILS